MHIISTIHIEKDSNYIFVIEYNNKGELHNILAGERSTRQIIYDSSINKEQHVIL